MHTTHKIQIGTTVIVVVILGLLSCGLYLKYYSMDVVGSTSVLGSSANPDSGLVASSLPAKGGFCYEKCMEFEYVIEGMRDNGNVQVKLMATSSQSALTQAQALLLADTGTYRIKEISSEAVVKHFATSSNSVVALSTRSNNKVGTSSVADTNQNLLGTYYEIHTYNNIVIRIYALTDEDALAIAAVAYTAPEGIDPEFVIIRRSEK